MTPSRHIMVPDPIWMGALLIAAMIAVASCVPSTNNDATSPETCEVNCPEDKVGIEWCPAFEECFEVEECDGVRFCVDPEVLEEEEPEEPAESSICDDDVEVICPDGYEAVAQCESASCIDMSFCDETLRCEPINSWCDDQPRCPDGARELPGCDMEACQRHHHCSGPVECLHCDDSLPTGCSGEQSEVTKAYCDVEGVECERVETCEQSLWCADHPCEEVSCPEGTEEVEACPSDSDLCLIQAGCQGGLHCQLVVDHQGCVSHPGCDEGQPLQDIASCGVDPTCHVEVGCEELVGCAKE